MYYGYRNVESSEEKELVKKMAHLAMHDTKGPKFTDALPDESAMPILPDIPELPLSDRLKNYPKEAIPSNFSGMFDSLMSSTHIPAQSQQLEEEWFGADGSDDDCDDDAEEEDLSTAIANLRSQRNDALEEQFGLDDGLQDDPIMKGTDFRSCLVGRFNETAELLKQIGDQSLANEFGEVLDGFNNKLHKKLREKRKRKSTSPTEQSDAAKKSQKVTSITSLKDTSGKSRVYCAKFGRL